VHTAKIVKNFNSKFTNSNKVFTVAKKLKYIVIRNYGYFLPNNALESLLQTGLGEMVRLLLNWLTPLIDTYLSICANNESLFCGYFLSKFGPVFWHSNTEICSLCVFNTTTNLYKEQDKEKKHCVCMLSTNHFFHCHII
jgi:hypothetical protein